jgi:hypothetical protein
MKHAMVFSFVAQAAVAALASVGGSALLIAPAQAQEKIYRCDNNVYTNTLQDPKAQGCKPLEGGNVTIVQGPRPVNAANNPAVKLASATQTSQPGQRVDAGDQRSRDSDARLILESELKRAESRKSELTTEYNNGEPEKRGDETRNHQKYLDRVTDLKASLGRIDSDIAGIRRELGRASKSN